MRLGDASEAAMQRALGDRVAEQIEQVAKVAEGHTSKGEDKRPVTTHSTEQQTINQMQKESCIAN